MELAYVVLAVIFLYREWAFRRLQEDWAKERRLLLTRIQAPEVAARLDAPKRAPVKQLSYDNDAAFWAAKQGADD